MAKNDILTYEEVFKLLDYNPETGILTRKNNPEKSKSWNAQWAGKKAGWVNDNGYLLVKINEKDYRSHRLIYLLMTKSWPKHDVDHINHIKTDNRWCNLRSGTRSDNLYNKTIQSNNKIGIKNVSIHQGKYRVELRQNGKRIFDASFDCPAAASVYAQLAQFKVAGDFAYHAVAVGGYIGK